jgi:hypothetical protein
MGSLKPGATYIYERANGVTYAREFGTTERRVVGMDYPRSEKTKDEIEKEMQEELMWNDIRRKAKSNPTLQSALDRAIMIYKLSEEKLE